ncbi:MAG: hypothetical protein HY331_04060 [Chloroflexi bacterium]|nr:hypothetical protein [Chloroflexota bacterium]
MERIQIALDSIRLLLADLSEVAAEWPSLSGANRASWASDWDQCMTSDLPLLERHFRANEMTAAQVQAFLQLVPALREALPTMVSLNLSRPPFLEESAA